MERNREFTKYEFYQVYGNPTSDVESFIDNPRLPKMHQKNRLWRLMTLPAMKKAIIPVVEKYLALLSEPLVLEVGCGAGFF